MLLLHPLSFSPSLLLHSFPCRDLKIEQDFIAPLSEHLITRLVDIGKNLITASESFVPEKIDLEKSRLKKITQTFVNTSLFLTEYVFFFFGML
jgi:hypothetical protein